MLLRQRTPLRQLLVSNRNVLGLVAAAVLAAGCGISSAPDDGVALATTATTAVAVETVSSGKDPTTTTSTEKSTSTSTASSTTSSSTSSSSTAAASTTTETPTTTSAAPAPSATLPVSDPGPAYQSSISEITPEIEERLTHSWREGCPVGLNELRYLTVTHWNFAGKPTTGELVVRQDAAQAMVTVFEQLYAARFPIERMELVDTYGGDDNLSMAANNTSAFNCREVAWKPGVWSNHAFGTAIDINPLINPYVSGTQVFPPEGQVFADRSVEALGGIYPESALVNAFASVGWGWGGDWNSAKDYQHFSASGN